MEKKSPCVTLAHQSCVTLAHQSADIGVTLAHQDVSHWRIEENTIGVPPLKSTKEEVSIQRRREDVVDEEGGQPPLFPLVMRESLARHEVRARKSTPKSLPMERNLPRENLFTKMNLPALKRPTKANPINSLGRRYVPLPTKAQYRGPPPAARGSTDPDTIARHAESRRRTALAIKAYQDGGDEAMKQCIDELNADREKERLERDRDGLDGLMDCSPPPAALNGRLRREANG